MSEGGRDRNWPGVLSLTSHELKNSLTVLIGYLRMLQGGKGGELTERQAQFIDLILKSGTVIRSVADQLSDLAKYEAGEVEGLVKRRGTVDVQRVLAAAIEELPEASDNPVDFDVVWTGPLVIDDGDSVALRGAFASLLGRFRTELVTSKRLLIRGGPRDVHGTPVNWISIATEEQLHLLDGDSPETLAAFELKGRSGWGLRLVIAERIIEAHGGRVLQKMERCGYGPVAIMLPRVSSLPMRAAQPWQQSARTSATGGE
jgi:signal transduction histidine kinase